MIGFIGTSFTISLNYNQYSAIADLHTFQFNVPHALWLSVFTSRLLATDLNIEVFLTFIFQSPLNLGTQLKILLYSKLHYTALCTNLSYNKSSLCMFRTDNTENISHVIPGQRVHWRADYGLATSYNIRPLRHIFHCCTVECVYRAFA
jgi:hypothetical protein